MLNNPILRENGREYSFNLSVYFLVICSKAVGNWRSVSVVIGEATYHVFVTFILTWLVLRHGRSSARVVRIPRAEIPFLYQLL